jgi:uncharacterized membrane protein YbaN (DUF454 family)
MKQFQNTKPDNLLLKTGILLLAGLCLLIGVIGVVLPIIPGILFLGLGAWLLAKVSRRAAAHLDARPGWQKAQRFWYRSRHLGIVGKLQLSLLLVCKTIVDSLRKISS